MCTGQQLVDIGSSSEAETGSSSPLLEETSLSEDQIKLIKNTAQNVSALLPTPSLLQPKLVQNKKRVSRYFFKIY